MGTSVPPQQKGKAVAPMIDHPDKENMDPYFTGHISSGSAAGSGPCSLPASKQFQGGMSSNSAKRRTPLADITALCLLQPSLPPQSQPSQGASSSLQKGLWGTMSTDKLGGMGSTTTGPLPGQRLASMR